MTWSRAASRAASLGSCLDLCKNTDGRFSLHTHKHVACGKIRRPKWAVAGATMARACSPPGHRATRCTCRLLVFTHLRTSLATDGGTTSFGAILISVIEPPSSRFGLILAIMLSLASASLSFSAPTVVASGMVIWFQRGQHLHRHRAAWVIQLLYCLWTWDVAVGGRSEMPPPSSMCFDALLVFEDGLDGQLFALGT